MIKRLLGRPIAVTMSMIAIIILGIVSMNYIPISLMPDIDIPSITVQVSAPGKSAREINKSILNKLMGQLTQVSGLESIIGEAHSDAARISMTFTPGSDLNMIFIGVNEKMDRAMQLLPEDIGRPKVVKASATDIPAFYINVTLKDEIVGDTLTPPKSGERFAELSSYVRDVLSKRIEQLSEVALADISGCVYPEIVITPNYNKLNSMGVGVELIENAIKDNNINLSSLSIKDGLYRFNINFDSKISNKKEIENLLIKQEGRIYKLKELATIAEQIIPPTGIIRSNMKNGISIAIIKQADARMEDLKGSIDKLITNIEKENSKIKLDVTRDQTKLLSFSINNLTSNLLLGAILACLVVFFFMKDFRSPLLIIFTIPISLIITMMVFYLIGITINIISLSGLILGVGIMVDNSIIVIDYIFQEWNKNSNLKTAISDAVSKVFAPLLSSVLTTCSVFIPLIFLSGIAGSLFYDQALAISISLFSSLLVSILLLPVYYYLLYHKKKPNDKNRFLDKYTSDAYYKYYENAYKWVMRHQKIVWVFFLLMLPGMFLVYSSIEKSRLPRIDHDDTLFSIDWNSGISLDENDRRVAEFTKSIYPYTQDITSMIGVQQFILPHTKDNAISQSIIYVKSKSNKDLKKTEKLALAFIAKTYPDAVISSSVSGNIFNMIFNEDEAKLRIKLKSNVGRSLSVDDALRVASLLKSSFPELVISPVILEENIQYVVNKEAMVMYNISYDMIYRRIKELLNTNEIYSISRGAYTIPITTSDAKADICSIQNAVVTNSDKIEVPLKLLITETKGKDFKNIEIDNGGEYYPIKISARDNEIPGIIKKVNNLLKDDQRVRAEYDGGYFSGRKMTKELIMVLVVAIFLLYFILAAQFESIIQPMIILLEVVVDMFLVMLILFLLGESLNIMSMIGLIVISGIVINDSILKVDTMNKLRSSGYGLLRAVTMSGHLRLKSILMTTITTVLAVMPFLNRVDMGSDLQYPLSLVIIVGMLVGTLVSLYFIPLAYYNIYRVVGSIKSRKK